MRKLLKNKKGFTLAELLIVVAIIGVLVAVSIPIFTAQLKKARVATNQANARAAEAAAIAAELTKPTTESAGGTYIYDVAKATIDKNATTIAKGEAVEGNNIVGMSETKFGNATATRWLIEIGDDGSVKAIQGEMPANTNANGG